MTNSILTLAQNSNSGGGAGALLFAGVFFLIWLAVVVFVFYCFWKVFEKAGQPGWAGIIPIYNMYILVTKIALQPWWVMLGYFGTVLMIIPILGWVAGPIVVLATSIFVAINVAKNFGRSLGFAIGLAFLPIIFIPILAFGDSKFVPVSKPLAI